MLFGISTNGRLIMGRLERGDDLEEGLLQICSESSIRCGEIRAIGALSHVELCAYDQKRLQYGPPRKYSGNLEILSLLGNVSEKSGDRALHLHATLARDTDNGIQVIGGHVLSGKVFACEVTVRTCEDLILRRSLDEKTGLTLWTEKIQFPPINESHDEGSSTPDEQPQDEEPQKQTHTPITKPQPKPQPKEAEKKDESKVTWDEVLAATLESPPKTTKKREEKKLKTVQAADKPPVLVSESKLPLTKAEPKIEKEEENDPWKDAEIIDPQPGDIVIHPHFGKCKVERLEDGEFLHVRLESGRSGRLNLEIINLHLAGYEKGKQIFETRIRQS